MIRQRSTQLRSGLSLLEVILAFAVFMMSMAGITQLISMGHSQSLDASQQNTGLRLAQTKLAEVEAGVISMSGGASGTFDEAPNWQWEVIIDDAPATNVYEVTVHVWNSNNTRIDINLTQMICDPATMGNAAAAEAPTTGMGTP